MGAVTNVLLCSFIVIVTQGKVDFETDRPFLRVKLYGPATLECCYTTSLKSVKLTWIRRVQPANVTKGPENVTMSDLVTKGEKRATNAICGTLTFKSVRLNDTGLYQCWLSGSSAVFSHGTYLQVHKPLQKMINLSENTKNKILTAEGILLLLCVLLPAATILCQSKRLNELEKKKMNKEEENIYQGLNLDDCCAAYDQIERSQTHGPYQDVYNVTEEEEEIQLEKPE